MKTMGSKSTGLNRFSPAPPLNLNDSIFCKLQANEVMLIGIVDAFEGSE